MSLKWLWLTLLVGLAACGQGPAATQSPLPASALPVPAAGTYLYLRDPGGDVSVSLPSGALGKAGTLLSPDGRRAYSLDKPAQTGKLRLLVRDIPSMTLLKSAELDPYWSLPAISRADAGGTGEPGGLSAGGRWLVLTTPQGSHISRDWPSRFLVLDTTFSRTPQEISIPGDFEFDAISDDGGRLFLIEHQSQGTYNVRLYDLARGALDPNLIIDKFSPGERMRGTRIDSVVGPGARWLYSSYSAGGGKAFIHALGVGSNNTYAFCIDLPNSGNGTWDLALGSDRLYAFSPPEGVLVELSLGEPPRVLRTLTVPKASAAFHPFWLDAAAKETPGASARPALAPDGKTLYLPQDQTIWTVDIPAFSVRRRMPANSPVTGLAVDPDGWLYASTMTAAEVMRLDPRTGQVADRIPSNWGAALLRVRVLS